MKINEKKKALCLMSHFSSFGPYYDSVDMLTLLIDCIRLDRCHYSLSLSTATSARDWICHCHARTAVY